MSRVNENSRSLCWQMMNDHHCFRHVVGLRVPKNVCVRLCTYALCMHTHTNTRTHVHTYTYMYTRAHNKHTGMITNCTSLGNSFLFFEMVFISVILRFLDFPALLLRLVSGLVSLEIPSCSVACKSIVVAHVA